MYNDIMNSNNSGNFSLLHLHNSYFTSPLFELSQTEYETDQHNSNTIQKFDYTVQSCHSPTAMYNSQYEYHKLLQILRMFIIWSRLFYHFSLYFHKNLNCSS
jgi:hypothetical protein